MARWLKLNTARGLVPSKPSSDDRRSPRNVSNRYARPNSFDDDEGRLYALWHFHQTAGCATAVRARPIVSADLAARASRGGPAYQAQIGGVNSAPHSPRPPCKFLPRLHQLARRLLCGSPITSHPSLLPQLLWIAYIQTQGAGVSDKIRFPFLDIPQTSRRTTAPGSPLPISLPFLLQSGTGYGTAHAVSENLGRAPRL